MKNKELIIARGIPGGGKTTFANLISDIVFAADDYYTDKYGNYNWDPSKIGEAHKQCQQRTEFAMINDIPRICVANTSTTEKELKPYQDLAEKYGYRVFSIIVENRHGGSNVHGVPE